MAFEIKVKGIKYFLRENNDEVSYRVNSSSILCKDLLKELGLDVKMVGYFIFNGKPISLEGKINEEGTLQIVPFLSGG